MSSVEVAADNAVVIIQEDDLGAIVVPAPDLVTMIEVPEQGPPGPPGAGLPGSVGPPGEPGADGRTILYGLTDPTTAIGRDGDSYINTSTHFMFGPKAGAWPPGVSLVGPTGPAGATGATGAAGNTILYGATDPVAGTGVDGNFYINTTTHFMFGPKAGGTWPAGTSLIGPQGPAGAAGAGTPGTNPPLMNGTAAVGTSAAFSREDHVHPRDTALVRHDAPQSLTAAQQEQARINIFAAPLDALAFNGIQLNGSMEVSQQFGTAVTPVTPATVFNTLDNWIGLTSGTGRISVAQAPTGGWCPGFRFCLQATITTAQGSLGSGDIFVVQQHIEGSRIQRLAWGMNAQPITLAFWSGHHRTGLYSVAIVNGAGNRCYVATYTQNVADVAEYKTITIPGDVTGTWPVDNSKGLTLSFCMGGGVGYTTASVNTWLAGSFFAASGQINAVAATSDIFRLLGVVVLPGNEAPSAVRSPFIMRPTPQELSFCKRYYRRIGGEGVGDVCLAGNAAAGGSLMTSMPLEPAMRAAPTITQFGTFANTNVNSTGFYPATNSFGWQIAPVAGGNLTSLGNVGGFQLDARLA